MFYLIEYLIYLVLTFMFINYNRKNFKKIMKIGLRNRIRDEFFFLTI